MSDRTPKQRITAVATDPGVPCYHIANVALTEINRLEQLIADEQTKRKLAEDGLSALVGDTMADKERAMLLLRRADDNAEAMRSYAEKIVEAAGEFAGKVQFEADCYGDVVNTDDLRAAIVAFRTALSKNTPRYDAQGITCPSGWECWNAKCVEANTCQKVQALNARSNADILFPHTPECGIHHTSDDYGCTCGAEARAVNGVFNSRHEYRPQGGDSRGICQCGAPFLSVIHEVSGNSQGNPA